MLLQQLPQMYCFIVNSTGLEVNRVWVNWQFWSQTTSLSLLIIGVWNHLYYYPITSTLVCKFCVLLVQLYMLCLSSQVLSLSSPLGCVKYIEWRFCKCDFCPEFQSLPIRINWFLLLIAMRHEIALLCSQSLDQHFVLTKLKLSWNFVKLFIHQFYHLFWILYCIDFYIQFVLPFFVVNALLSSHFCKKVKCCGFGSMYVLEVLVRNKK